MLNESKGTTYLSLEEHKQLGFDYLAKIISDFENEVGDQNDPEFKLMSGHLSAVAECSLKIAQKEQLNEQDTIIFFVSAVLHDRGRLSQHKIIGKNVDTVYRHAILSVDAAFGHDEIYQVWPGIGRNSEEWNLILATVTNHMVSKDGIDATNFEGRERFFLDLIANADALANLGDKFCRTENAESLMLVNNHTLEELIISEIPDHIFEKLMAGKTIDYKNDIWDVEGANTAAGWYAAWLGHAQNISYPIAAQILLEDDCLRKMATIVEYSNSTTRMRMLQIAEIEEAYLQKIAKSK